MMVTLALSIAGSLCMAPEASASEPAQGAADVVPLSYCTPYTGGYLGNIECVWIGGNWTGVWVGQGIVITGVDVKAGIGSDGVPDVCASTHQECIP